MQHTLEIHKFKSNPLLQRKQFLVTVNHHGKPVFSRAQIREEISKIYNVNDVNRIVISGFVTKFGRGESLGFGRIYDSAAAAKKFENKHILTRLGIIEKTTAVNRRQKKDIKNKRKKVRGVAKAKIGGTGK